MARIRSVHPGLFTDESFMSCSPGAQVLFIGIWTEADDYGAFEWKPVTLKARILPAAMLDVNELLAELETNNMVRRYEHGGRQLGAVRNFCRFQRPKKPKASHFMPVEIGAYTGQGARDEPMVGDQFGTGGELTDDEGHNVPPNGGRVPKKSENSPQMEDGGGKKDRSSGDNLVAPRTPTLPRSNDAPAEALIAAADAVIAEHYGRSRPRRHRDDLAIAKGWAGRGIGPERLAAILDVAVGRFAASRPDDLPVSLRLFEADVDREEPPSQYPPGITSAEDQQWFDRVVAWTIKRVWFDHAGPPPDDPATLVPDRVLAAHGMTRRKAAAA